MVITNQFNFFFIQTIIFTNYFQVKIHFSQNIDFSQKQPKIKHGILKEVKINCSLPNQEYIMLKCLLDNDFLN